MMEHRVQEVAVLHDVRFTAQKIARRLVLIAPLVYRHGTPLPDFKYLRLDGPEDAPPVGPEVDTDAWETVAAEAMWGAWRTDFVLRTTFTIPADWPSDVPVALYLPLGELGDFSHPEALAYVDGEAYAACDRHHQEILLAERWRDGQPHQLALHGWSGGQRENSPRPWMRTCQVVAIDQPTRDFLVLARVALEAADVLDSDAGPTRDRLLNALDAAFKVLDTRDPLGEAFYASLPEALRVLKEGIAQAGPPLDVDVTAAGHAHIDVAWLWTLGQTRRKAGRTFHTVQRLMDQFPAYSFTQSQPQLYDFVRQDYPELFAAIKARVAEGRWEPIGGMWVEADCNLSGPESLARQFLLGRSFFREHFGPDAETPVLWLPDVFGYAWALPQLIKQAGLDYFFTIKIGWNQYNRLPYDSFWWEGIDGTRVLTHFSTTPEDVNDLDQPGDVQRVSVAAHGVGDLGQLPAQRGPARPPDELRLRRRRGRAQPRDAGEHPDHGALPGAAPDALRAGGGFLPPAGSGERLEAAHLERRAVSGAAPGDVHHPGP